MSRTACETKLALSRFICSPLRPDDVFALFHPDPDLIAVEDLRDVEIRSDVAQALRRAVVVESPWFAMSRGR